MTSRDDVQRTIATFHDIAIPVPFAVFGGSDNNNPTDVIAQILASGLGMPDRDYYLKTEPRFVEARQKYLAHVAKMFTLAGYAVAARAGRGRDRPRLENAARRGLARQCRAARSEGDGPQDPLCRSADADAGVRLDRVLRATSICRPTT